MTMTQFVTTALFCIGLSLTCMSEVNSLSDTALLDALEKGRSLMHVDILSVQKTVEERTAFYSYRAAVRALIVPGDLTDADVADPIELFAGASYGGTLRVGGSYLVFVTKDAPYSFCWAHRGDVVEVPQEDRDAVAQVATQARRIYTKTDLREFRNADAKAAGYSPAIPDTILSICKKFKSRPKDRCESAKAIWESDIGSHRDESRPWSSTTIFLPPRIPLARANLLDLLGETDIKVGYCYKWYCGEDTDGHAGVLSVVFRPSETVATLVYGGERLEYWIRQKGSSNKPSEATR